MIQHPVAVARDKFYKGARTVEDLSTVKRMDMVSWSSAFHESWASDAHFVGYRLRDVSGSLDAGSIDLPRLNKSVMPALERAQLAVRVHTLAIDYDLPGHREWTGRDEVEEWIALLASCADKGFELAMDWTALYTTRHGARLVYRYKGGVEPEEHEGHYRWIVQQFHDHGIHVDSATYEWNRMFRLPRVLRDDQATEEEACFDWLEQPTNALDPARLGSLSCYTDPNFNAPGSVLRTRHRAEVKEIVQDMPTPVEVFDLLHATSEKTGRAVQPEWLKAAKARLRGRECLPVIFEGKRLAEPGARNPTLLRMVGEAVGCLYYLRKPSIDARHVFALFTPAVDVLEEDDGPETWHQTLWRFIRHAWEQEDAQYRAREEEHQQQQQDALTIFDSIREGMLQWMDHPALHGKPKEYASFISERLIAACGSSCYIMRPDGYYHRHPVRRDLVIPQIKKLGMTSVIPIQALSANGKTMKDRGDREVINSHAYPVHEIRGVPQSGGSYIEDDRLYVELYRRRDDLKPTWNDAVDRWLQALFGAHYEPAMRWIAYALAFEEGPICALSIKGPPGCGKGMFIQGLSECIDTQTVANDTDLTSDYAPGIMKSPFLHVDEGWTRGSGKGKHPADTFRQLTGGGSVLVNQKYLAPIHVQNPLRIVFTANNLNVVQFLTGGRDLSPEDRDALALRVMHFSVSAKGSQWLRTRGGVKLTRGWVKPDGPGRSDYTVARHFLWLYENRSILGAPDPRLLVEGNGHESLLREMQTSSGSAPLIVETLLNMAETMLGLQSKGEPMRLTAGAIQLGGVLVPVIYCTLADIVDYYRKRIKPETGISLSYPQARTVLQGLSAVPPFRWVRPQDRKAGRDSRTMYHAIDAEQLLHAAQQDGRASDRLQATVASARAHAEEQGADHFHIKIRRGS